MPCHIICHPYRVTVIIFVLKLEPSLDPPGDRTDPEIHHAGRQP